MLRFIKIVLAVVFFLNTLYCFGTHNRAGEITYEHISGFSYKITITTYTAIPPITNVDRDSLEVQWGDGNRKYIRRVQIIPINKDMQMNIYIGYHTYPGPGDYCIKMEDPNRNGGSINIYNSINIPFALKSCIGAKFSSYIGGNNSPVLLMPPIGFANVGELYEYNPTASDPDGDSLYFELVPCKGAGGINIPGYLYPDEAGFNIPGSFNIDNKTGEITWDVPLTIGEYNIAIKITEYRDDRFVGSVIRDMQIFVLDINNQPPIVEDINDTCVMVGDLLVINVNAHDPNTDQKVTLTAHGGPLEFTLNPATFTADPPADSVSGVFSWTPTCNNVRSQFYEVVFRAEDDYEFLNVAKHLSGIETWLVWVIAPPPQNLVANITSGDEIKLTWDSLYTCSSFANFDGFSIWRRIGSNPFTPDSCETGLGGKGYTRIAKNVADYSYVDKSVEKGANYCYRIFAMFSDGAASVPSNEVCAELLKDVPVLTNISVESTSPNSVDLGKIYVAWSKPLAANLDTISNPGPYKYVLSRADNFSGNNPVTIDSFMSATFATLNDSSYIDSSIVTSILPYSYSIDFYGGASNLIGITPFSSSVLLSIAASDRKLSVSWEEEVTWMNEKYYIYRSDSFSGAYVLIDSSYVPTYSDKGLVNGEDYCYYVQSVGTYGATGLIDPLLNKSQIMCGIPVDTIPPCPPELKVSNYCDFSPDVIWSGIKFENYLLWSSPLSVCGDDDVSSYRVYYSEDEESSMTLLTTIFSPTDTSFTHSGLQSLAGCYGVTAVDVYNNESSMIKVCVDNCPFYELPNAFTPNGDYDNDFFTPFIPYRFVDRIDMKVFNRWGQMVYETHDPDILWDGTDLSSGKPASEGVYFYICDIYTVRLDGEVKIKLPGGFIHLFR